MSLAAAEDTLGADALGPPTPDGEQHASLTTEVAGSVGSESACKEDVGAVVAQLVLLRFPPAEQQSALLVVESAGFTSKVFEEQQLVA
ncbi:hypothetical protein [Pseudomonas sp. MPDS]|uniref:hypothetical protein n=1 Tax=Pseudomonas sp. MPDS TaxID=2762896 RepID=UPI0013CF2A30|nr:hypothetical protein [Pseudomonas sp. MPDS]QKJ33286.1 hypothetical protein HQ912_01310 [Pseudomonas sp. MPDS]